MEETSQNSKAINNLFLKEYWLCTEPSQWSAVGYSIAAIKHNPDAEERDTMYNFARDLDLLYIINIDNSNLKKRISGLQHVSKKAANKGGRIALKAFWQKHADEIKELAEEDAVNAERVEGSLKHEAVSKIVTRSRGTKRAEASSSSSIASSSRRRLVAREKKTEHDNIHVCDNPRSVGTMIKQEAVKLHKELENGQELTVRQRKIMTNGLSSILDLSDNSFASQRSLFSDDEWTAVNQTFEEALALEVNPLSKKLNDTIVVLENTLRLSGDYKCCLKYLNRLLETETSEEAICGLSALVVIVKSIQKYPYLLTKTGNRKVTESDYLRCLWSPLLEAMFPPELDLIRIKSGESISQASRGNKQEVYFDQPNVKSFKIDIRLLVDDGDEEIDLAVGESAADDDDSKAIADEGKLAREGKDTLDQIIKIVPENLGGNTCWTIQTTGSYCSLSTVDLAACGLYVVKHRCSFHLPITDSCFGDFRTPLQWLLVMRKQLLALRNLVKKHNATKCSNDKSFNRKGKQKANPKLAFLRGTYYSPPPKQASKLPEYMYGPEPQQIEAAPSTSTSSLTDGGTSEGLDIVGEADVYGFQALGNGHYYNVFTKSIFEAHPFDD